MKTIFNVLWISGILGGPLVIGVQDARPILVLLNPHPCLNIYIVCICCCSVGRTVLEVFAMFNI